MTLRDDPLIALYAARKGLLAQLLLTHHVSGEPPRVRQPNLSASAIAERALLWPQFDDLNACIRRSKKAEHE